MEIQNKHKIKLFHGPLVWHLLPSFHALQCTWILYTGVQYFTSSGPSLAMSLGPKKLTSYFQLKWSHRLPFSSLKHHPCFCKKFMRGFFPELLGIVLFISLLTTASSISSSMHTSELGSHRLFWASWYCTGRFDVMISLRFKGLLCSRLCSLSALGLFATVSSIYLYDWSFLFILWSLL